MRRIGFLEILLAVLTLTAVLFIFALVLALASPQTTERLVVTLRESLQSTMGPSFDKASRAVVSVTDRALSGYDYRIRPIPEKIGNFLATREERETEVEKRHKLDKAFKKCVSCHKEVMERTAYNAIYIDHTLHKKRGVRCERCHINTSHNPPAIPPEQTCLDCHKDKRGRDGFTLVAGGQQSTKVCSFCHTPASIVDVVPKEYITHFMDNRQVHRKLLSNPGAFQVPSLKDPKKYGVCQNCHQVPRFCNQCHLVFHNTLPNWIPTHGPAILRGQYQPRGCWQCHSATWCATKCHPNNNRQRGGPRLDVPTVPLRTR